MASPAVDSRGETTLNGNLWLPLFLLIRLFYSARVPTGAPEAEADTNDNADKPQELGFPAGCDGRPGSRSSNSSFSLIC